MNKSNGLCKLCNTTTESLCHLIFECNQVRPVWQKVDNILSTITGCNSALNSEIVILGVKNEKNSIEIFCNFVVFNAKWCIWKHRNEVRYGNKTQKNAEALLKNVVRFCINECNILDQSKLKNKLNKDIVPMLESLKSYRT